MLRSFYWQTRGFSKDATMARRSLNTSWVLHEMHSANSKFNQLFYWEFYFIFRSLGAVYRSDFTVLFVQSDAENPWELITLAGNTKGGSITVPLTSVWLVWISLFANKNKSCHCHTADSKPVKQDFNGTVILPPLVFSDWSPVQLPGQKRTKILLKI